MTNALKPSFPAGLYGITPEWSDTARLLDAVRAAHAGGLQALQYRRKQAEAPERRTQLQSLAELCVTLGLPLLINDDWQWVNEFPVQGAHLGKEDGSLTEARGLLGKHALLGSSCYDSLLLAQQAQRQGADYVAFGAIYPSKVKPEAPPAALETLSQARVWCASLPPEQRPCIVAIGGISPENAAAVIDAGAQSLAVISALFEAPDVYRRAQQFQQLFLDAH